MRFFLTLLATALGLCPASASAKDEPTPDWVSRVRVMQEGDFTTGGEFPWLSSADMPANLKNVPFRASSYLAIDVDTQGNPSGCTPLKTSRDAGLDAIACGKLMQNATFSRLYGAPAKPIAYKANLTVSWSTVPRGTPEEEQASRPGPIPVPSPSSLPDDYRAWPRLKWEGGLQIDSFPDLQSLRPAGARKPAIGTTSLDLIVERDKGIVDCTVGVSSGNAALDEAACSAAMALPLSYPEPCSAWCRRMYFPLQFVWLKKGSHIRVPLPFWQSKPIPHDPADPRPIVAAVQYRTAPPISAEPKDFADIADKSLPNPRVLFRLSIDRDGKVTGCEMLIPSGNRAIDARFCALMSKVRYGLRTDAFGDPAAYREIRPANLTGMF